MRASSTVMMRQRIGLLGATAISVTLLVFALAWLVQPARTSLIFGVALEGAATAYGRVKGAEDLLAATALALALWRREPSTVAGLLLVGLIVPAGDMLALASAGLTTGNDLAIHVVFIAIMAASSALLYGARKEVAR